MITWQQQQQQQLNFLSQLLGVGHAILCNNVLHWLSQAYHNPLLLFWLLTDSENIETLSITLVEFSVPIIHNIIKSINMKKPSSMPFSRRCASSCFQTLMTDECCSRIKTKFQFFINEFQRFDRWLVRSNERLARLDNDSNNYVYRTTVSRDERSWQVFLYLILSLLSL